MQVKVWNKSDFTWRERFKNKEIVIEPHGHIMMGRDDALQFASTFVVPKLDANRQIVPESQKMIWIDPKEAYGPHLYAKDADVRFVCQADGREFTSKKELDAYVKANWKQAQEEPDAAETTDAPVKRGRGRPPKNVSEGI